MHTFSLSGNGLSRLSVDGEAIVDTWTGRDFFDLNPWSIEEVRGETTLAAGRIYRLVVEYGWQGSSPWRQVRIGYWSPCPEDLLDRAAAAAARSDVAIVFAGLTDEWEKEGEDRTDLELRGEQAELIQRVAAVNPNTIVVLNTGAPVTMDWLSEVPAVLQAWYGGQEAGNAIADVLFGDTNPSGKLPTTFPKRLQDNPSYINYPGENGKVFYGDGIFVGYRYYDKKDIEPLFPFGFGLSYTSFDYSNIILNTDEYKQGDEITVAVDVQNTGQRTGKEVVQLYIRDLISSLIRPDKELKRFAKVNLEPGEKKTVKFTLNADDLAFYDDADMCWRVEPGEFEILIGSSSRDIRQKERIRLVA
jgi:beta-glucosidase